MTHIAQLVAEFQNQKKIFFLSRRLTSPVLRLLSDVSARLMSLVSCHPSVWGRDGLAITWFDARRETSKRHKTTRQRDPIDDLITAKGCSKLYALLLSKFNWSRIA